MNLEDRVFCSVTQQNEFAQKVAEFCGEREDIDHFFEAEVYSGGEFCPKFTIDVKGKTVYIIANPDLKVSAQDMLTRICFAANTAKENGAQNVVLIQSDLQYGRQDRSPFEDEKFHGQQNTTLLQAKLFHMSGIDRILSMHIHSINAYIAYGQTYGGQKGKEFGQQLQKALVKLSRPDAIAPAKRQLHEHIDTLRQKLEEMGREVIYSLDPNPALAHYLLFRSSLDIVSEGENIVFIAPDKGARVNTDRLQSLMFLPKSSVAYCKKIRTSPNNPDEVQVELDGMTDNYHGIDGKIVILGDDIVDTAGTMIKTAKGLLRYNNGRKSGSGPAALYLTFTHPVLAGNSYQQIQKRMTTLRPREIITFNTHPYIENERIPEWKKVSSVLRIARWVSDAIKNCLEQGIHPKDAYAVSTREELQEKFSKLYDVKRSTLHFLERVE